MTSADPFREWDAAYVLGALEPGDRRAYEDHLGVCDECREAVGELAGMPGVLRLLPSTEVGDLARVADPAATVGHGEGPGPAGLAGTSGPVQLADVVPLARVAGAARRHRRRRTTLVAAAAGVLVVAGVAGGYAVAGERAAPTPVATGAVQRLELRPADSSGVAAELTLTERTWGTRLEWSCTYPPPPTPPAGTAGYGPTYELVVVDADGTSTVVATWSAHDGTARGLGASTSVPAESIRTVQIRTTGSAMPLAWADT